MSQGVGLASCLPKAAWPPTSDIDVLTLKQAGVVSTLASDVRVILAGEIKKAVKLTGITATKGAKAAIEAAGGSVA